MAEIENDYDLLVIILIYSDTFIHTDFFLLEHSDFQQVHIRI